MHSIGNERDARTILDWVTPQRQKYDAPRCAWREEAPEGWSYLGRGSFRSVWLSPEGVAYKVDHQADRWCDQSSRELINLTRAWCRGQTVEGCRLPKFHGYEFDGEVVVAIEAIKGRRLYEYKGPGRDRMYDLMYDIEEEYGLQDMHDENVMVDENGHLVPVDFGC